jgi:Tetracyclin repressor-like, C-terminal domain
MLELQQMARGIGLGAWSREARRQDDRSHLREFQEPRRALYRVRPDVLGADRSRDHAGRTVRRGDARAREGRASRVDERAPVAVGRLTGLAYTLTNPELRSRVHEITKSSYALGAEWLRPFDPSELPMPPESLVRVLHVLIEGLVMQRLLTPRLCPDEVFYAAFAALAPK